MAHSREQLASLHEVVCKEPEESSSVSSPETSSKESQSPSTTTSQETKSTSPAGSSQAAQKPITTSVTDPTECLDLQKEPIATMAYKRQLFWAHKLGVIPAKNRKPKSNYASAQLKKAAADPLLWQIRTLEHLQQITPENLIFTEKPRKEDFVTALGSLDTPQQWMLSGFVVLDDPDEEHEFEEQEVDGGDTEGGDVEEGDVEEGDAEEGDVHCEKAGDGEIDDEEVEDPASKSSTKSVKTVSQKELDSSDEVTIQASIQSQVASAYTMKPKDLPTKPKHLTSRATKSEPITRASAIGIEATYEDSSEIHHSSDAKQNVKIVRKLPNRSKDNYEHPVPATESEHEKGVERT